MDIQTVVYAALVLFVAYLVRGIAGFGSGLIAVPMLTLAPVPLVVPLVVSLDYIGSASQGMKSGLCGMERAVLAGPLYARGHRRRAAAVARHAHGSVAQSARRLCHHLCHLPALALPALGARGSGRSCVAVSADSSGPCLGRVDPST